VQVALRKLFLAASFALVGGATSAQQQFNGRWSVEVVTEKGSCDKAYRYLVVIEKGKVRYGGPESFDVSGSINARGVIKGSVSRGASQAHVVGRLTGNSGTGTWTTSGSASCSGRWSAEKRD
jgi:hypothetical protein